MSPLCTLLVVPIALAGAPVFAAPGPIVASRLAGHAVFEAPPRPDGRPAAPSSARPLSSPRAALYPTYAWPLERAPRQDLVVGYRVDHDPTAGILDYMGGDWTYDGHRGTDLGLPDFRDQDRGVVVRAAAPGTVVHIEQSPFDRGCAGPPVDNGNFIEVDNGDGTSTFYYHLRAFSRTVEVGDAVQTGQMLGLVGSSGFSFGPHLHFEAGDALDMGNYHARDPYSGPSNPLPSLWAAQDPYPPTLPFWAGRVTVTTETALGGLDYCSVFLERPDEVAVFGLAEPYLHLTFPVQCGADETLHVEVRRPDDSVWAGFDSPWNETPGGIAWYSFFWNGGVAATDSGTWAFRALSDGVVRAQRSFRVGATTVYAPRVAAPAGRSFRIDGTVQRDTLRRSPRGGPLVWSLPGAPPFVTLAQDSIVQVAGSSSQTHRSFFFQAVGTDAAGRRDTAWYHVVDPGKPTNPIVDVPQAPPGAALRLDPAWPNPSATGTTIDYELPARSVVRLAIFDLAGRRVRQLVDGDEPAGAHRVAWDGRDARGDRLGAGVYFARLEAAGQTTARKLVRTD